jgi:hypothetical protein
LLSLLEGELGEPRSIQLEKSSFEPLANSSLEKPGVFIPTTLHFEKQLKKQLTIHGREETSSKTRTAFSNQNPKRKEQHDADTSRTQQEETAMVVVFV